MALNLVELALNLVELLHVDVGLVEESMWMIGGLQSLARTQSSQYVLNGSYWVCHVAF